MKTTLEAIFENGVFKPVARPEIPEGERVQITVESLGSVPAEDILAIATSVYKGLSARDIDEIESMARRRDFFSREHA